MRIASIDLPWGAENFLGIAWTDAATPSAPVQLASLRAPSTSLDDAPGWAGVLDLLGERCDLLLLDQPLGMPHPQLDAGPRRPRPVERAWGNRFFCEASTGRKIQFPRFQPGNDHCQVGLRRARAAAAAIGTSKAVVLEIFPQLIVPVLLQVNPSGVSTDAVTGLASHKSGRTKADAQRQLVDLITAFCLRPVRWPESVSFGAGGAADMVDSALGLIAGLSLCGFLPHGRPPAIRLVQPEDAQPLPRNRAEVILEDRRWWAPTEGWISASTSSVQVPANGILALKWW